MALETATYISDLNSSNPDAADVIGQGDDHLRLIKSAVKATFPNVSGAVTPTHTELNYVDGVTSAIQTQMDLKAPLASPTFTGTVVLPATTSIGSVDGTELGYVNGVTSAIQTQLDAKLAISTAGRWVLIETLTASSSATLVSSAISSYSMIMVEFIGLVAATNAVEFWMRTSTNSGVSYDSGASDYTNMPQATESGAGAWTSTGRGAGSKLILNGSGASIANSYGVNGTLYVYAPGSAASCYATWQITFPYSGGGVGMAIGSGRREATADVTNLQFLFQTGNITSGSIRIYGR